MTQKKFKGAHYFEIYTQIPLSIHAAFQIYRSGDAIYFVSKKGGDSIIGIDLDDILTTIEESNTFIILTSLGRVVFFAGGEIIAQYYSQIKAY